MNPYLISNIYASGRVLRSIRARDKAFQEGWLQDLVFKHPAILPIDYMDKAYAPLV